MSQTTELSPVLTLEEVAGYLQLPKEIVERQATQGRIPGRCIEATWRFLKDAIDEWLRSQDSRTVLLQQAGALADDDTLPALRAAIYAKRGLAETEALLDLLRVIPFDASAAVRFDQLRKTKGLRKIGRADLLIASITLALHARWSHATSVISSKYPGLTVW